MFPINLRDLTVSDDVLKAALAQTGAPSSAADIRRRGRLERFSRRVMNQALDGKVKCGARMVSSLRGGDPQIVFSRARRDRRIFRSALHWQ